MTISLADIVRSPDHYLHSFDGVDAVIVPMDRAAYHRSIFLDGRISTAADGALRVPIAAFGAVAPPADMGLILHLAHCGSTLLARALDTGAANLVLREPFALRQMGLACEAPRLDLTLAMLARRYDNALPTIAKANVPVNFILPQIAARMPNARILCLHMGLRHWLMAVLRSADHRRWVRGVAGQLGHHLGDLSRLADAEVGAALWRAQMRAFAQAMQHWPGARNLDAEQFLSDPAPVVASAAHHLGVPMRDGEVDALVGGPLFGNDAKRPNQPFDNGRRLERRAALEKTLEAELDQAERWIAGQDGGGLVLDRPLS